MKMKSVIYLLRSLIFLTRVKNELCQFSKNSLMIKAATVASRNIMQYWLALHGKKEILLRIFL